MPECARASDRDAILRLHREYLMPCARHFYERPPVFVAADDCELIDVEGRRYLDLFSGVAVVNAGHCNPDIARAVDAQMRKLDHTTSIYLSEPLARLAERLAATMPPGLKRSFFCVSGSEANEGALLLAATHTGRSEVVAMRGALHGRTKASMSATGLPMWRWDPAPLPNCHHVAHGAEPGALNELRSAIERIGPHRVAAVIAEPVLGNGGVEIPPREYWRAVRKLCDEHGILLIFDEVQTGMNRTGAWWAAQRYGVTPDILTTAKALANGYPLAAFVARDAVAASFTKPYASTFGGNPVAAAAALATIDYHERHDLASRARERGAQLLEGVRRLAEGCSDLRRPRGLGLMIAVDVVDAGGRAAPARLDAILEAAKDRGVLLGKTGPERNVLTLLPPLTISSAQVNAGLAVIEEVLGNGT